MHFLSVLTDRVCCPSAIVRVMPLYWTCGRVAYLWKVCEKFVNLKGFFCVWTLSKGCGWAQSKYDSSVKYRVVMCMSCHMRVHWVTEWWLCVTVAVEWQTSATKKLQCWWCYYCPVVGGGMKEWISCITMSIREITIPKMPRSKHMKGSKELFIRTDHNIWIFRVIPFIKLQNNT